MKGNLLQKLLILINLHWCLSQGRAQNTLLLVTWSSGPLVVYLLDEWKLIDFRLDLQFPTAAPILLFKLTFWCSRWMLWDSFSSTGKNSYRCCGGLVFTELWKFEKLRGITAQMVFVLVLVVFGVWITGEINLGQNKDLESGWDNKS